MQQVILVDENNNEIGIEEKILAHKKGSMHRAFSIFIFNRENELLLQKRAKSKYHSSDLWSNTCCSHPRPGMNIFSEMKSRLMAEMGFICEINWAFDFTYISKFDNNLIENEYDSVYIGYFNGNPIPNENEVSDWKWENLGKISTLIKLYPEKYSTWFIIALPKVIDFLQKKVG